MRRVLQLAAHAAVVVASSSYGNVLADRGGEVKIDEPGSPVTEAETCDQDNETCSLPVITSTDHLKECGLWVAPSSLPGAGLGMFAGRDFEKNELMQPSGDVVIPIIDILMHQRGRKKFNFLWDEYTWNGRSLGIGHEIMKECNAASPGFGAAANCFLDLVNVEEGDPYNIMPNGLHRSKDPGVGAFSTYQNRTSKAKVKVRKGQELFVNYGQHWFEQRERLGPIPLRRGLKKSTTFYRRFKKIRDENPKINHLVFDELWDTFVKQSVWNESRIFGAFYNTDSERYMLEKNMTLKQIRVEESMRQQEWLGENGICADHIKADVSTIRQAGMGAFATRALPQGALVSHLPLIQIIDRTVLEMYELKDIKTKVRAQRAISGYQIMVNYCFGHTNSTMLLCPYAPMGCLVNHNQTRANLKLQWSDPKRSNHVPDYLDMTIDEFAEDRTANLALDFVATRPIAEGEELFLDYGDTWEKAWQDHVRNWNVQGADEYVSAFMLNKNASFTPFRTEFEQIEQPYPGNVNLECDSEVWNRINQTLFSTTLVINHTKAEDHINYWNCDVLRRRTVNGTDLYTVIVTRPEDKKKKKKKAEEEKEKEKKIEKHLKLDDIPSIAIRFTDRPYTSDMFLKEAFRHSIMVSDDLWPSSWMNFSPA